MKTATHKIFRTASIALGLSLATAACATDGEDVDVIADDIELDDGGLDMDDELPLFGEPELFANLDLTADETDIVDEYASDAEVLAVSDAPDAVMDELFIAWGGGDEVTDWSGSITISAGVMVARRAVRFEGADRVQPRTNPRRIDFNSRTLRHHDGLRIRLAARADNATGREITIDMGGESRTVRLDELLDRPEVRDVGDRGDRIVLVAHRRPIDVCDNGFMRGKWHQLGRGYGVFHGRVANSDGELIGNMRGFYGQRRNGDRAFFGKYINRAGEFKGIFGGTYRDGHFAGRWKVRGGDHGLLGGVYRESAPGNRVGGGYIGRWAETSCNARGLSDRLPDDRN